MRPTSLRARVHIAPANTQGAYDVNRLLHFPYNQRTGTGIRAEKQTKGHGWLPCEEHRGEAWAVYYRHKLVGRYGLLVKAIESLRITRERAQGPRRNYKLGKPMGPKA
jgi:hypothetical protein